MIGSDQVATYDGLQIGKPGTHENALRPTAGDARAQSVEFHSALCLFDSRSGDVQSADIITRVQFRDLSDAEIEAYLRAETPYDVAGSAKSEGLGIALLDAIDSDDPTALVGLPLIALSRMLRAAGFPLLEAAMSGVLYLIPNTLGDGDAAALAQVLPEPVRARAAALTYYIGENAKTTRAFLKKVGTERPIQEIEIRELNVNTPPGEVEKLLAPILAGTDAGLVSEAGCPAVADPGALLVRRAHERGVKVVPFVGPSSILLALMASGMNGQSFAFNGYLPVDATERAKRLRELEQLSRKAKQTQIFIETPYRNKRAAGHVARDLRAVDARLRGRGSDVAGGDDRHAARSRSGKREPAPDLHKRPAIFLLLAAEALPEGRTVNVHAALFGSRLPCKQGISTQCMLAHRQRAIRHAELAHDAPTLHATRTPRRTVRGALRLHS